MKIYLTFLLGLSLTILSCDKTAESTHATTENTAENEASLEQDARSLTNDKGEKLTVVYFAEGDMVAVKIKKDGGAEHRLSAKGVNERGEPMFSDGEYVWEMMEDGQTGKLTDKSGVTETYRP